MLVLIEKHVKCVMMNKGHKMMPYLKKKKKKKKKNTIACFFEKKIAF